MKTIRFKQCKFKICRLMFDIFNSPLIFWALESFRGPPLQFCKTHIDHEMHPIGSGQLMLHACCRPGPGVCQASEQSWGLPRLPSVMNCELEVSGEINLPLIWIALVKVFDHSKRETEINARSVGVSAMNLTMELKEYMHTFCTFWESSNQIETRKVIVLRDWLRSKQIPSHLHKSWGEVEGPKVWPALAWDGSLMMVFCLWNNSEDQSVEQDTS